MQQITLPSAPNVEVVPVAKLHGRWLLIARVSWYAVAGLMLALLLVSVPAYVQLIGVVTEQEQAAGKMLGAMALYSPTPDYEFWIDVIYNALSFASSAMCLALAAVIFFRKPNEVIAFVTSITLLLFGIVMTGPLEMLIGQRIEGESVAIFAQMLLWGFVIFLFYVFPDGKFVPTFTRWFAIVLVPWALTLALLQPFSLDPKTFLPFMLLYTIPSLTAPFAQIYRYRRVSNTLQRQQTKWVVLGFTAWILLGTAVTGILAYLAVQFLVPANPTPTFGSSLLVSAARLMWPLSLLFIPLSLTIAITRYHLWDIDLILNRTLVYGALTASIIVLYVFVVALLGMFFQAVGGGSNLLVSLITTAVIAVVFQPLRERLQRAVNRLTYGERDEPYKVLARLGQRLESTLAPDAVLPTIVETVAQAMNVPYVAIELESSAQRVLSAAYGNSLRLAQPSMLIRLPLIYQHETLGALVVAPRVGEQEFSAADLRLLGDLTRQAGVAAHSVQLTTDLQRLTADLQRSREHLVTAREEERRRLRRDLHDGLGPTLAALALNASTVRDLIRNDSDAAIQLASELQIEIRAAVAEIRRLVYALRPPTLDELGLVAAIHELANHSGGYPRAANAGNGLYIKVEAPDRMPPLPAAVEVAAYRIVQEALTNVVRHAHAQHCSIRISLDNTESLQLNLKVCDDGIGLPDERRAGVGLHSMRDRAEELGGTFVTESNEPSGTRVVARLPIRSE